VTGDIEPAASQTLDATNPDKQPTAEDAMRATIITLSISEDERERFEVVASSGARFWQVRPTRRTGSRRPHRPDRDVPAPMARRGRLVARGVERYGRP
jgi:hypothetical protein